MNQWRFNLVLLRDGIDHDTQVLRLSGSLSGRGAAGSAADQLAGAGIGADDRGNGSSFGVRDGKECGHSYSDEKTSSKHSVAAMRWAKRRQGIEPQCYHLRMPVGQCAGYVLAGGRSSRMGRDKALLEWNGSTLLGHACEAVNRAAGSAVIVGDPVRYGGLGYAVIEDQFRGAGPLGGVHAALTSTEADWNLVAACDMPGLAAEPLRMLLGQVARFPGAHAIIPEIGGRPQPLCAVYHRRCLPRMEQALMEGRFKIMLAIAEADAVRLPVENEGLFRNVNTPEEWTALGSARS